MKKVYTKEDAITEVKRELEVREKFYPRWIADNKISEERAKRQKLALAEALAILEETGPKKQDPKKALKELRRELKMRMKVYPRWIVDKKLHRDRANKQYLGLEQALKIIEAKEGIAYNQTTLFPIKNNYDAND